MDENKHGAIEHWKNSRSGAWAGRGFHYQHLVSVFILVRQWAGLAPTGFLVPEGLDDCVVEIADHNIWLQIKSRKDNTFSDTEVQKFLSVIRTNAAAIKGGKENRAGVVIENHRTGRVEADIDQMFADEWPSVFVCGEPGEEAVKIISKQVDTAEVIAEGVVNDLYRLVAEASQENASLPYDRRRRISTTEAERRILQRLEAEDPSAIHHAMASGALEPVDFTSAVSEPAFYQGVKVVPGHVAAGLVLDRTADTDVVVRALRRRRHAILTGPSGTGKSALLWLSAKLLTGEFRWYQITGRALSADADAIIRFVRARRPTETSPIGLAFDDIGSANHDLWDVLVRELRGMPEVYFLGSIRREDVSLIANQADTEFITVSLNEKLADSVWQRLRTEEQTRWEHWREPYEQSEGLMLEYVHLLTQGQRLQAVIDEQVRQRMNERRFDELALIRSTAVICSRGGEVKASKLFELLNLKPDKAGRALTRLLDEHLVRESRPGVLGGLHTLRSQALADASHDEAAFLSEVTLWQSLSAVTASTLPTTVQAIILEARDEAAALRKLAEILGASSDLATWTGILTGLGLATLERRVSSFMDELVQYDVQRAQWSLASMFGDPDIDIPELSEFDDWQKLRGAVLAFRALPKDDLRPACLEYLPSSSDLPDCEDLRQANTFLSCLTPICGGDPVGLPMTPNLVGTGEQDIGEVASLLSTAYLIGPDVAENLVEALGGEHVLFGWFRSQTPWVTIPEVDPNGSHGRTVRSDWYHVAESEQPDPHEVICGICETLISISPGSDAAASDAVNPLGHTIAIGDFRPWSKNMPRQNLPAKARVAWNVAFRQILLARSASDTLTDYTRQMGDLVKRTEKVFRSFTEKWIKGKTIANSDALAKEVNAIVQAVNALAYAAPEKSESEMTSSAAGTVSDDALGALLTGVLGNLMGRMSKAPGDGTKGTASFAGGLSAQAHDQGLSAIWRTSSEPPLRELSALKERLSDVASILHEMAFDGGPSSIQGIIQAAQKGSIGKATRSAARRCHSLADQRFRRRLQGLESALKNEGCDARCWSRPTDEADSVYWPAREVAVLFEIVDFETDGEYIEATLAAGQDHLGNDWRFRVVPLINGYVVPTLALLPPSTFPLPDQDFAADWCDHIDRPFLSLGIVGSFDEALAACMKLSGILACRDLENLHPDEHEVFSKLIETFERLQQKVAEAAEHRDTEQLVWACDYLSETWGQVVDEFEAVKAGQPVTQPLCMNAHLALAGQASDQSEELAAVRILLIQDECLNSLKSGL
jgi:hypothetical protein